MAPADPLRPITYGFEVHFKAFIPNTVHAKPGDPWLDEPGSVGYDFKTDDHDLFVDGGSARIHSWARFDRTSTPTLTSEVGPSHQRWEKTAAFLLGPPAPPSAFADYTGEDEDYYYYQRTAPKGGEMNEQILSHEVSEDLKFVNCRLRFTGQAAYPFSPLSPNIDYTIDLFVNFTSAYIIMGGGGTHNKFPGYELYLKLDSRIIGYYSYDPKKHGETGPGLINLNSTVRCAFIRAPVPPSRS